MDHRYACEMCGQRFCTTQEVSLHHAEAGLMHRFVEVLRPAPGDHIYTAQYKSPAGGSDLEDDDAFTDDMKKFVVGLVSLPEHHGVYIGGSPGGDGEVVHFDGCDRGIFLAGDCQVGVTSLDDFSRGSRTFLKLHEAVLPPTEVVDRARWALGKRGYHCQAFNCEHFAAWCCTGAAASSQAWYSSIYVDPVFPFGWAAAVVKDASHCASDLLAANARRCPCDPGSKGLAARSEAARCNAGHYICTDCLAAHRATSAAAAGSCDSSMESDSAGPLKARAAAAADAGGTRPSAAARPLCCLRPACWEPLLPLGSAQPWRRQVHRRHTARDLGSRPCNAIAAAVAAETNRRHTAQDLASGPSIAVPAATLAAATASSAVPWRRQAWHPRRARRHTEGRVASFESAEAEGSTQDASPSGFL